MRPATSALDLDAIPKPQGKNGNRQPQRGGQVSGGHDAQVRMRRVMTRRTVDLSPDRRQQVHRQHVHEVHQKDPDEHRKTQRRNELAAFSTGNVGLGLVVNHFHQHLYSRLEATGHTRGCLTGG
ncbi:hypothetical protein D3C71_1706280 [compost metagenome]